MTDKTYYQPSHYAEASIEIKKSRFFAQAFPIRSEAEAKQAIAQVKAQAPSANHHCSAFIVASPHAADGYGFSDDGEPSGTAGRPMYSVIQGADIGGICITVTRYFGGTKLGTGGLVRAYSASVREVIAHLQLTTVKPMTQLTLSFPYTLSANVEAILHHFDVVICNQDYTESVRLVIQVDHTTTRALIERLKEGCRGQLTISGDDH